MHIIEDDPFTRRPITLEDLKVHDGQLELPGWGKRHLETEAEPTEQDTTSETNGTNGTAASLGRAALNGDSPHAITD